MALTSRRPKRKTTGGRYHEYQKKRANQSRRLPTLTKLGNKKAIELRKLGGSRKTLLLECNEANVYSPKEKKYVLAKIKTITDNKANRHFVRRNILTKGAIIETDIGKARITSRPGQEGTVNAVLIK
ncbi:MAG: 30S ribosomal protein S8e [Candidatus Nanoarchaeia archaeon]|nr:30S ribosomal protein S8e [Candidatus Nanoarchaeia archaeon]